MINALISEYGRGLMVGDWRADSVMMVMHCYYLNYNYDIEVRKSTTRGVARDMHDLHRILHMMHDT